MMYPLVEDLAAEGVRVASSCRVLGFSPQAFYKWKAQPYSDSEWHDAHLVNAIVDVHADDPEFGYRFITDELERAGHRVGENRVHRLCRENQVWSVFAKKRGHGRKVGPPVHDDLVQRHFAADAPDRVWLTDITEHWTDEGKLYLCAFKDVCSGRIVGYAMSDRMTKHLAIAALNHAADRRSTAGVVVHSDRGSQSGFNWSLQHLIPGGVHGSSTTSSRPSDPPEVAVAWSPEVPASRGCGVLGCDRERPAARGSVRRRGRCAGGWGPVVPSRWWHGAVRHQHPGHRPLPVLRRTRGDRSAARPGQGRARDRPHGWSGSGNDLTGVAPQRSDAVGHERVSGIGRTVEGGHGRSATQGREACREPATAGLCPGASCRTDQPT